MKYRFLIISLFFLLVREIWSQPVYISVSNEAGLVSAINTANGLAQTTASKKIYIQLNAAAPIQITSILPVITTGTGNGTITIEKHPSATVPQGIQAAFAFLVGFNVNNCQNSSSMVVFNNIGIWDTPNTTWSYLPNKYFGNGIELSSCENTISVNSCTLQGNINTNGIVNEKTRYLTVTGTLFKQQREGFYEKTKTTNLTSLNPSRTFIDNCEFRAVCNNPTFWLGPSMTGVHIEGLKNSLPSNYSHTCSINNCQIGNAEAGILFHHDADYNTANPNFLVSITNNNFYERGLAGIVFYKPMRHFIVDNNYFDTAPTFNIGWLGNNHFPAAYAVGGSNISITSGANSGITAGLFGLDFIGPNSLGLTQKNANNTFMSVPFMPFIYCRPQNPYSRELEVNLVGLNVNSYIAVEHDRCVTVRECVLVSKPSSFQAGCPGPISLAYYGSQGYGWYGPYPPSNLCGANCLIESPVITGASRPTPNTLNITFNLVLPSSVPSSPIVNSKGPFVVEFFKSNSNGDLVTFLGSYLINTLQFSNQYSAIINAPGITTGDRIGATITSLGTNSTPKDPVGTSAVSYFTIPYLCSLEISPALQNGTVCAGPLSFSMTCPVNNSVTWDFGDGTFAGGPTTSHTFAGPGFYNIQCITTDPSTSGYLVYTMPIQLVDCNTCKTCIGSFAPEAGDYMVSLWVKEDNSNVSATPAVSYPNTGIRVTLSYPIASGIPSQVYTAYGGSSDPIIDGWQRIEKRITIPSGATEFYMELVNNNSSGIDSYFDDVRIHPVDANMKSYVYDPVTLRLTAELDENNYGTFYEYDEEGHLTRVKKETEKGIMTIKETRTVTSKR